MCFCFDPGIAFPSSIFPYSSLWGKDSAGAAGSAGVSGQKRWLAWSGDGSGSGWLRGLGEMSCRTACLAPPASGAELGRVVVVNVMCKAPGDGMAFLSPSSVPGQELCCAHPFSTHHLIQCSQWPDEEGMTMSVFIEI